MTSLTKPRPLRLLPWLLLLSLLSGCAAQRAHNEGMQLASEGKNAESLQQFEEAMRLDPDSARYRLAVSNARDAIATEEGKTTRGLLKNGDNKDARQALERSLSDPRLAGRAADKLHELDRNSQHQDLLKKARESFEKNEFSKSSALVRRILIEDPQQADALQLQSAIQQKALDTRGVGENALAEAFRKPITIEFKDAPLKAIFEVISRTSGINFLFDRDVRADQKTSIFLRNSTIESAIRLTLMSSQLEQLVLDSNTVLIYPKTDAKLREYQPLKVRIFYLSNADAKNVAATLKTILKTRDLVTDDKLNMIVMRDSEDAIRLAEKLVAAHDVAEPEVMLEVEVVEINRKRLLELGIRWPGQLSLSPLGPNEEGLTLADLWSASRDRSGRTIGATVGSTSINARKVDSDGEVLANPRIRVRNREKAKILIGDRVPNITSTSSSVGFVAESINYVDVGLKLDVEPIVYVDDEVAITISLEVSNIVDQLTTQAGSVAYRIGTRSAQTVLRLKDGETQVLAGLLSNEERSSANKVPGLGELPVAGRLFGSQLDDDNRTEIVLSITPRILRNIQRPGAHTLEFHSGTDASVSASPLITGATGSTTAAGSTKTAAPGLSNQNQSGGTVASNPSPNNVVAEPPPIPQGNHLRWQGPSQLRKGDTVAVQLIMQSDQPVVSLPISLGFDPKAIQILSVTEGDFLRQGGGKTSFAQRVDPSGQVLLTGTSTSATGATGSATVATINMRLLSSAPAETALRVIAAAPVSLQGQAVSLPLPSPMVIVAQP